MIEQHNEGWTRSSWYAERRRYSDEVTAITDRNCAYAVYDGPRTVVCKRAPTPTMARAKADEAARRHMAGEAVA